MKKPFEMAEQPTELMRSMAEKVGVDWSELDDCRPEIIHKYRNATFTCEQFKAAGECVDWQKDHDHAEQAPVYCQNKNIFEDLTKL